MHNDTLKSKKLSTLRLIGYFLLIPAIGVPSIHAVENLASTRQEALASLVNSSVLKAETPAENSGPQTLYFRTRGEFVEIPPIQVSSLEDCFSRAKAEMRRMIDAGNRETAFAPRCHDEKTGQVRVIGQKG